MRDKIAVLAAELLDTTTDNLDFHDDAVWCVDIHRKFVSIEGDCGSCQGKASGGFKLLLYVQSEAGPMSQRAHFAKVQVDTVTRRD